MIFASTWAQRSGGDAHCRQHLFAALSLAPSVEARAVYPVANLANSCTTCS